MSSRVFWQATRGLLFLGGNALPRTGIVLRTVIMAMVLGLAAAPQPGRAAKLTMQDGRTLTGRIGRVAGVAEDPDKPAKQFGGVAVQPILVLDNGLTRTFVPQQRVAAILEAADPPRERIRLRQPVARRGLRVGSVGPIERITPFDEHGRRIFSMRTVKGRADVIQGITEITPVYTRVESLLGGRKPYVWEMRIATSSIPRETLSKILSRTIDPKQPDQRLKIVRLLLQSERYKDARTELEKVLADFPDLQALKAQVRSLRQLTARRLLEEIKLRQGAGQHQLVQSLLRRFPAEGAAGETLIEVREILDKYKSQQRAGRQIIADLKTWRSTLDGQVPRQRAAPICEEIIRELNFNTLPRMTALRRLADDAKLGNSQKLALAISGWLLGSNHATENLSVALSLGDVRALVRKYLREPLVATREKILGGLRVEEGATLQQVARLIAHMKPPLDIPAPQSGLAGYYVRRVPGAAGGPDTRYFVQLPPEYDPHRHYPMIVTLNGAGSTPKLQIDWWAGGVTSQGRRGQATRYGYITMAIEWLKPYQRTYAYSARAHRVVLSCLRDACRRFAIDSDRVFLSGHDIGGDAAWDMGLAHPDLWAGVIPIVAIADRYCARYWENAHYVPFYVIGGELDGDKIYRNALSLDRYLRRHYDVTVVEYLGRGHENFHDAIQRLFAWMAKRRRNFFPRAFQCATMRPWDNFFWWLEVANLPPRSMVDPVDWPPSRGSRAVQVSGAIKHNNALFAKAGGGRATIWLAPEIVDFNKRVRITVDGRRIGSRGAPIRPDLSVLLEDVRTRGDRQHPFWARVSNRRGK